MQDVEWRRLRTAVAACLLAAAGAQAGASLLMDAPEGGYPEIETPPPPAFNADRAIDVSLKAVSNLTLGIDPATISVGSDGVVRYVAILRNGSGKTTTAIYEGIRCNNAEVKVYARQYADGEWQKPQEPKWQSLYDPGPTQYSLRIANAGVCQDAAPNRSRERIEQTLRNANNLMLPP